MKQAQVTGLWGMPGSGKSQIAKEIAPSLDALTCDNDTHGYPPIMRIKDAERLGLKSVDTPSDAMKELAKLHNIAFEARVRDIASQGFNVVMQSPGEGFGHKGTDGKALIDGMRERMQAAGCSLESAYLVPLPGSVRKDMKGFTLSPDELAEFLRNPDVFDQICHGLDERFVERGVTEAQRMLDAPKLGNPDFVRGRLSSVERSMRESQIPAVPVFLDESIGVSASRVLAQFRSLRASQK